MYKDSIVGATTGGGADMYELTIPRTPMPIGAYLRASFVGYEPKVVGINFNDKRQNDIKLKSSDNLLGEVTITAQKKEKEVPDEKVDGKVKMTLEQTKTTPTKGWKSFSKLKKGLIIGGASIGVLLLIVGLSMRIKKSKKN